MKGSDVEIAWEEGDADLTVAEWTARIRGVLGLPPSFSLCQDMRSGPLEAKCTLNEWQLGPGDHQQ